MAKDAGGQTWREAGAPASLTPCKLMVAEPWDRLRGRKVEGVSEFDVSIDGNAQRLRRQASMSLVQHWAPDCSTFSRALGKPCPGAPPGKGPLPMRSMRRPAGLPWKELVDRFKGSAKVVQEKLDLHNFMANLAAEESRSRIWWRHSGVRSFVWTICVRVVGFPKF